MKRDFQAGDRVAVYGGLQHTTFKFTGQRGIVKNFTPLTASEVWVVFDAPAPTPTGWVHVKQLRRLKKRPIKRIFIRDNIVEVLE